MKNFKNLFINSSKTTEQFCFVVDGSRYYRFNGKYAMYEQAVVSEKKEYAARTGNTCESKQVYGIFTGNCPSCGHPLENVPIIKLKRSLECICESCCAIFEPNKIQSIVSVLDIHINQKECVDYEEIELEEEEQIADFVLDDDVMEE